MVVIATILNLLMFGLLCAMWYKAGYKDGYKDGYYDRVCERRSKYEPKGGE